MFYIVNWSYVCIVYMCIAYIYVYVCVLSLKNRFERLYKWKNNWSFWNTYQ